MLSIADIRCPFDCRDVLPDINSDSVDSIVTDPPYELGFMGKRWDASGVAFSTDLWKECLRVLKPGGHLLAFGGTRTYHRLTCAIEDAGFEIRDSLHWIYGSGFPKSLDVSKAIDKAAGAEREVVGEGQPFGRGSMRNKSRVEQGYRPTEINPDGGTAQITAPATDDARRWSGFGTALKPAHEPIVLARKPLSGTVAATVLAHGTGALNIDGCRIATGEDTRRNARGGENGLNGESTFRIRERRAEDQPPRDGRWPANVILTHSATCNDGPCTPDCPVAELDTQSDASSRFFPVFRYQAKAPARERPSVNGVAHPTVKPLELVRWLIRLVTPPGGVVLDPFLGSGTTAEACLLEGFGCIGIERDKDLLSLIDVRLQRHSTKLAPC